MGILEAVIPPELKEFIEKLKITYPVLERRVKSIEKEIHAISYYLAHKDPDLWEEAIDFADKVIAKEDAHIKKMLRRRGLE